MDTLRFYRHHSKFGKKRIKIKKGGADCTHTHTYYHAPLSLSISLLLTLIITPSHTHSFTHKNIITFTHTRYLTQLQSLTQTHTHTPLMLKKSINSNEGGYNRREIRILSLIALLEDKFLFSFFCCERKVGKN